MKNNEIVAALRTTESRSKRELLDTAANLIEKLTARCARLAEEIAVVMAFVSEDGLVDVEMDCVLDGVTHWMPLPEGPEVE